MNDFILGVNYWPRRKAMYWWKNFEAQEVEEEFSLIRDLGLGLVRIFLLWEDFQPTPDTISEKTLECLVTVADIAAQKGLTLDVTFFTGHMSGPNWVPPWLLDGPCPPINRQRETISQGKVVDRRYRNPFHDPEALEAEKLLLSTVVLALKDHPAIALWNLGNEPDLLAWPRNHEEGYCWVKEMVRTIRTIDSRHPTTCGLHTASLTEDNGFRVHEVFGATDLAVMHAYPMYSPLARHPLDFEYTLFTCALTASLCGRPVLLEEFGGCTAPPQEPSKVWEWESCGKKCQQFMASEEDLAEHIHQVLSELVEIGALGALLWCFADYAPELWDKPPCKEHKHERFFGLVRPDGSLKPHARVVRGFAATGPRVKPIPEYARLPVDPKDFYTAPSEHSAQLYSRYLALRGRN